MEIWGMAATSLAEPRRPEPSLDWRLVNDARTSIDIGLVNAAAYAMPQEQFAVSHNVHEWSGKCYGIVGYDGEMPVTASLAFIRDRQIYVGWVATLPDRHGQGLGEAAMRRSIVAAQEAAKRSLPIWLHATEAGRPLYRSMGFEDAGQTTFHTLTAAAGNSE
jgi:GNAT superfamily N-acetyltransferase